MTRTAETVSALVCHGHVDMALACLGSLKRNVAGQLALRIHDDGSLTDQDCARLEAMLDARIIRRPQADERLIDEYHRYPGILALRKHFALMLKAFDAVVWAQEPVFAFSDSDVLFLHPIHNPFVLPGDPAVNALFMQDRAPSYSLRSWGKLLSPTVALPAMANSGMIVCERPLIDLDRLEWFVGKRRHHAIAGMVEQTWWASHGARAGCAVFDPGQVRIMREGEDTDDLLIGHFTAKTRHLLQDFVRRSRDTAEPQALRKVRLVDAGQCSALDLCRYEARRLMDRTRLMLSQRISRRGAGSAASIRPG